ncbi:MAG: mechanosensitive ion channel [Candidatus Aminicenantes bacterium]|nr:mechanosensitive ion channel [Candidatus Aminicenantes bacterium]NIM83690.1 mechanosensitive ion channel [Candidatus Aminicenantes bacterium]NIN23115.1 mechanosensitive ion channel [Candidatus Aminicenantes bacterium]NIN46842.1 mechanosensitive ion channel [Candidatus Aminicenantes bacterium]NIN89764.1 mechanosensitive ion channel [Candidatus Aminicenantes bacterium]
MDYWNIWKAALPIIIIFASFIIGIIIRVTVLKRLSNLAKKSKSKLDDVFLESLQSVIVLWFVLLGVYISINILPLPQKETQLMEHIFKALLVFSIFWFLIQLMGKFFLTYSEKLQAKVPAATIIKNAVKILILTIGLLLILQTLGISITPIITTLGVGGLAVALAMQDTLANLFAGFHIIATKRVKTNDYIKLDSGEEGYVVDITWRDTLLRQLPNNHIIIPNSRLSSAVVTNYYRPQKALNVLVEVGIDYSSDLEKAEQVTLEVAREILKEVAGGDEKWEPFMRYHTFGDSSINFTVYLRCKEFFDKFLVQHEFIKRLKKRYDQEGITIPFPIRTVIMKNE